MIPRRKAPDADPEPEPYIPADNREDERLRSVDWRRYQLEAIGVPYPLALELALAGTDWHRVARAVDRGMTMKQVEEVFL